MAPAAVDGGGGGVRADGGACSVELAVSIAGSKACSQVLTFRGATGWQIESLAGSLVHLTDSKTLRMESGAWRIGTINGAASIAMFLAAAPICVWSSWRGARLDRVGAGWLASVSALLLLSALLSAQYVIWLAPAAGIAWAQGEKRLALLTAVAIVLTQLLWSYYGAVLDGALPALLLVVRAQHRARGDRRQRDRAAGVPTDRRLTTITIRKNRRSRTEETAEIAKAAEGHFFEKK